jgi:hypothetical protein
VTSSSSIRGENDWRGKQYTVAVDEALQSIACGALCRYAPRLSQRDFASSSVVIEPISHHISVVNAEILGQYLIAIVLWPSFRDSLCTVASVTPRKPKQNKIVMPRELRLHAPRTSRSNEEGHLLKILGSKP